MADFNPTSRYRALRLRQLFASRWVVVTLIVCSVVAVPAIYVSPYFGVAFGALAGLFAWLFAYATTFHSRAHTPNATNWTTRADDHLLRLLGKSWRHGAPEELDVLLGLLLEQQEIQAVLARLELSAETVKQAIRMHVLPDFSWSGLTHLLGPYLAQEKQALLTTLDIFSVFFFHPRMRQFLRQHSLQESDITFVGWWQQAVQEYRRNKRQWWTAENLLDFSGVGLSWAAGYTPFVNQFSRPPGGSAWDEGAAHEEQVKLLINSLARQRQSNVLLIGQPGVGRIGVIKELMRRVATGTAHPILNDQRVLYAHIPQLLSLGKTTAEQLQFVSQALTEMEQAGNVIAVLDGLGSIVGGGEGHVDLGEILVPFFSSAKVRVVVVMSTEDYHRRIAGNGELEHLFEIVEVPPLTEETTLRLLALSVENWEKPNKLFIPYKTLQEIVDSTAAILPHIPFPEKAFDVLEELVVEARNRKQSVIRVEDLHALIARKTGINIGRVKADEAARLLSLPDYIHRRVVNQEQGVEAVARAMVRARAGVRSRKRPIGSFLFLGPTGVGKTEVAKALAEAFFGSDSYLQRLDMSEFQGGDAIERLVGTLDQPVGRLPAIISRHPFCVLLLDEFEKADRSAQELFLPLFDEGYLTDAHGRRYSFVHTIIIATSNAGAEFIRDEVKDDGALPSDFDLQLREHVLSQGIFLPELLNRFDGIITFAPLSAAHVRQIAQLMLYDMNRRLDAEHGITIRITEELVNYLATTGYDPQFGARPMRRLIQDTVEWWAAQQIIAGRVEAGQELIVPVPQKNVAQ